jgi:hypothetical protein
MFRVEKNKVFLLQTENTKQVSYAGFSEWLSLEHCFWFHYSTLPALSHKDLPSGRKTAEIKRPGCN